MVKSLLAMRGQTVGNKKEGKRGKEGKRIQHSWCQRLTDMAGLPQEWRRTLAAVVTIHVQAGASIFARLGGALILV